MSTLHGYDPGTYGDKWAETYDDRTRARISGQATAAAVATLAELAPDRHVLELGIGTGRIALPLAARGFDVHGIDASEAMVAKLRNKPSGDAIDVSIGDFVDVNADGPFGLVFVVFSTFLG